MIAAEDYPLLTAQTLPVSYPDYPAASAMPSAYPSLMPAAYPQQAVPYPSLMPTAYPVSGGSTDQLWQPGAIDLSLLQEMTSSVDDGFYDDGSGNWEPVGIDDATGFDDESLFGLDAVKKRKVKRPVKRVVKPASTATAAKPVSSGGGWQDKIPDVAAALLAYRQQRDLLRAQKDLAMNGKELIPPEMVAPQVKVRVDAEPELIETAGKTIGSGLSSGLKALAIGGAVLGGLYLMTRPSRQVRAA
ncbi:hypothetical protein [Leeia sp.]|uniref:hypothetical protein n=1 Tax=Leeia sp. TaxID=2884678 RepID=UPI0035B13E10